MAAGRAVVDRVAAAAGSVPLRVRGTPDVVSVCGSFRAVRLPSRGGVAGRGVSVPDASCRSITMRESSR